MSIISSHKEYVLERLLLQYLLKGEIPTADVLEEDLEEYKKTHPFFNEPTSKLADFDVTRAGESQASKIQEISKYISDDASIANRELRHLLEKGKAHYERWTVELYRLLNKAKRLEHEVDTLLFLQGDTAGYFSQVSDIFVDTAKLDMELTTAKIDTEANSATLDPDAPVSPDGSGGSRLDLSAMVESDVFFSVLSTTPTGYSPKPGAKLVNMFVSPSEGWQGAVNKSSGGEVVCELKARISRMEDLQVSRIIYNSNAGDFGGGGTVTCMHSTDGYQWYMVDHPTPTQSLDAGTVSWHFPLTKMRWLKFLLKKNNYDEYSNGTYYYNFGAESVRLYGSMYSTTTGSTLVTQALQPLDYEDKVTPFTKASLDVCEENVDSENLGTNVKYYLSASTDGESWVGETQVEPASRPNKIWPPVANFSGAGKVDNTKDTDLFQKLYASGLYAYNLTREVDSEYISYGYKDGNYGFVNTAIPLVDENDDALSVQHISNSLEVWRNIFDPNTPSNTVRDVPIGWGKGDDRYYCRFYIGTAKGVTLDFGPSKCVIDGVEQTGKASVPKGVHSFSTAVGNWHNIYTDSYSPPGNEEEFEAVDPLYPHNHKLLLEGFKYSNTFEGERSYEEGADIVAEYYCKRTSTYDLENNIPEDEKNGYFAFVKSLGKEDSPAAGVLLYRRMSFEDIDNEKCRILWNTGKGAYKYIKLRAVLSTTSEENTPVLYSYRIKIGS